MIRNVLAVGVMVAAAAGQAHAEEPFAGRWAVSTEICGSHGGDTPQNAALVATSTSLWWFDGYCRIGKMYKTTAVYVQAHCGGRDVSVTLDPKGDHMKVSWDRGKAEDLKRCP